MDSLFADSNINFLIVNSFEHYKTTVKTGGCVMFDFLVRRGIIDKDPVKVRGCILQAMQDLKIDDKNNASVINRAKALYVDSVFAEIKSAGIPIRHFLQGAIMEMNKV